MAKRGLHSTHLYTDSLYNTMYNSPTSMYSCSTLPEDNNARVRASSRDNNLVGVEMARDLGRLRFGVTGSNESK
jgi:hypothetical protein